MGVTNYDTTARTYRADRSQDYELSILTGMDSFAYAIRQRTENRLLAYYSHTFTADELIDWPQSLRRLVEQDPRLHGPRYGRTLLGWDTPVMTLVPRELYAPGQPAAYLEQLTEVGPDEEVRHERLAEINAELVYTVRRGPLRAAESALRSLRTYHYAGGLLSAWARHARRTVARTIVCNLRGPRLLLAGYDKGSLQYVNSFRYGNSQDAIYYLLLAYEQCNWLPEQVPLYLSGELVVEGELYQQFGRYVRNIHFSTPAAPPSIPPALESLPSHVYFDLLCPS